MYGARMLTWDGRIGYLGSKYPFTLYSGSKYPFTLHSGSKFVEEIESEPEILNQWFRECNVLFERVEKIPIVSLNTPSLYDVCPIHEQFCLKALVGVLQ